MPKGKILTTPLWVISFFVIIIETVIGAGIIKTTGSIQIALTVFVIVFPFSVAAAFFYILWYKPYVLYSPFDFGDKAVMADYVDAMSNGIKQIKEISDEAVFYVREIKKLKDISEKNSSEIVCFRTDVLKQADEIEQKIEDAIEHAVTMSLIMSS